MIEVCAAVRRRACAMGVALAAMLGGLGISASDAHAQIGGDRYAAIVQDANSGNVLIAASPDELRHPASLTKMMTLYMAFGALSEGSLDLSTPLVVSSNAAYKSPSKLGLSVGSTLTVEEAILALVTKSANDAAAALGEALGGGSEYHFAQMMTLKARALGMTRTTFRNASGLPDPEQVTTARDMALLGRRLLRDYPDRFAYFSTPAFNFRGQTIFNHNRLLNEYEGADGIKTGYVNDSGFNLVASASRDGTRLVAAVFGGSTGRERDRHMMALLDQGFAQLGIEPRSRTYMVSRHSPQWVASASARGAGRIASARQRGRHAVQVAQATGRHGRVVERMEEGDTERADIVRGARRRTGLLRTVGLRPPASTGGKHGLAAIHAPTPQKHQTPTRQHKARQHKTRR